MPNGEGGIAMKIEVRWKCAHCGHKHCWKWETWDVERQRIAMKCDKCARETTCLMKANGKCRRAKP
jgi:hypothetical protein